MNRTLELPGLPPIAVSTITALKTKPVGEGDGILQMLLWLGRSPESFIVDMNGLPSDPGPLPDVRPRVLRVHTIALHKALNTARVERNLTWEQLAREMRGVTPATLAHLSKGGRTGFPHLTRLTRWLGRPAVDFTRAAFR